MCLTLLKNVLFSLVALALGNYRMLASMLAKLPLPIFTLPCVVIHRFFQHI